MRFLLKLLAPLRLVPLLLLIAGCTTTPSIALPPAAPLVVKDAEILPLSPELKKQPPSSGSYLKRAEQRRTATLESLKTLPPR
jgi:hypothetical protein